MDSWHARCLRPGNRCRSINGRIEKPVPRRKFVPIGPALSPLARAASTNVGHWWARWIQAATPDTGLWASPKAASTSRSVLGGPNRHCPVCTIAIPPGCGWIGASRRLGRCRIPNLRPKEDEPGSVARLAACAMAAASVAPNAIGSTGKLALYMNRFVVSPEVRGGAMCSLAQGPPAGQAMRSREDVRIASSAAALITYIHSSGSCSPDQSGSLSGHDGKRGQHARRT